MKELDENMGKIYVENDFYYLEKVYTCMEEMMIEEPEVKKRAKKHNFKIVSCKWYIEKNPFHHIEKILNETKKEIDKNRYRFKLKLTYKK
tara:strand:- start:719 stop:988 length:270 start_codon:yes stop_codon:yes gene_type:complete